jgi:hypothetical protein
MGSTNRTMRLSMFNFSFIVSMVRGSAAALNMGTKVAAREIKENISKIANN